MFALRGSEPCAFKLSSLACFMHDSNNASMFVASTSEFPQYENLSSIILREFCKCDGI